MDLDIIINAATHNAIIITDTATTCAGTCSLAFNLLYQSRVDTATFETWIKNGHCACIGSSNVTSATPSSIDLLHAVCSYHHTDLLNMLTVLPGCDVNVKSLPENMTPLQYLLDDDFMAGNPDIFEPHMDTVEALMQAGADVNLVNERMGGMYPIHYAAQYDHVELMRLLLDTGAQVSYSLVLNFIIKIYDILCLV